MHVTRRDLLVGFLSAVSLAGCRLSQPEQGVGLADPSPPNDPAQRLFAAIERGDIGAIDALLDASPELIDARDSAGRTPFGVALLSARAVVTQHLRARGATPDLIESAWIGDWDRFVTLASDSRERLDAMHPLGGGAMFAAAMGGRGGEIWRVYAECALPNPPARAATALSPLRAAFEFADLEIAELTAATLLSNAADPNAPEPGGSSALHAAAARGSHELVAMLIRKFASVDARDQAGRRPVDLAQTNGHHEVAAMLARHQEIARDHVALRHAFDLDGARCRPPSLDDVSRVDQSSFTGMGHSNLEGLRERLAADPRLVHASATTSELAIEAATHVGRVDIATFLLDHGAPLSMPTAVLLGDVGRVSRLLDAAPERIHERGPHDFALLWYPVIARGSLDMAQLLIQRGAVVEDQHYLGTTALHWAASDGQLDMVNLLVEAGADIDRVGRKFDAVGHTPLELARERGQDRVVRWLEERNARARR